MEKHKKFQQLEKGGIRAIIRESEKRCIVLLLTAGWLGSSFILERFLQEEGSKFPEVKLYKADIEKNRELAGKLDIRQLPATFFFYQGEVAGLLQGLHNRSRIRKKIAELTGKSG